MVRLFGALDKPIRMYYTRACGDKEIRRGHTIVVTYLSIIGRLFIRLPQKYKSGYI